MPRTAATKPITIKELKRKVDWLSMYPLVKQSNPEMKKREFETLLAGMLAAGYRCIGAYKADKLVGVAGFWVGYRFWCGKYIDIDNVVVDKNHRGKSVGKQLLAWLEKEGQRLKCHIAVLDSYTRSHRSHRFYFREGYVILGYHFTKDL